MQIFIEQFYTALAWVSVLGLAGFILWILAFLGERLEKRTQKDNFKKPKPGDNPAYDFMQDCCEHAPGSQLYASDLYDAYRVWCEDQSMEPGGRIVFGRELTKMGLQRQKHQWIVYLNIDFNSKTKRRLAEKSVTSR